MVIVLVRQVFHQLDLLEAIVGYRLRRSRRGWRAGLCDVGEKLEGSGGDHRHKRVVVREAAGR